MASSYMRYSHSVNEIFSGFWETWGYLDSNFKRRLIFFFRSKNCEMAEKA